MNQGLLTLLGRLVFASATVVIFQTAANAQERDLAGSSSQIEAKVNQKQQISQNSAANELIIGQRPTRRPRAENNSLVPEAVAKAVIQNLSQQTGIETGSLTVVETKQQTWTDGCLGISSPGVPCAEGRIPGWEVVVASTNQRWVYRSNISGSLVKLDALGTQNLAKRPRESTSQTSSSTASTSGSQTTTRTPRPTTQTSQGTTTRTQQQTTATTRRQTTQPTSTSQTSEGTTPRHQTATQGTGEFSLAVWQPASNLSEVVARISIMSKDSGYSGEQLIGDYRYQVNQRARFVGGVNPGDRIVVRLYNYQNRLVGFTEFEVLPQNTSANIILGNRPLASRVVRTVYGIDSDKNSAIDRGVPTYDFYTEVGGTTAGQETVSFLKDTQGIEGTWYQVAGLPVPPQTGAYSSAVRGSQAEVSKINVYSPSLPATITSAPGSQGQVVNVAANNASIFNLNQQSTSATSQTTRTTTRQATPRSSQTTRTTTSQATPTTSETTSEVLASFADVPANYWARKFISQLATKGILQGYPDGLYRPKASLTRAEFAIIISGAFNKDKKREVVNLKDVASNYWAYPAIKDAYEKGFLDADSSGNFRPTENITRLDVLVALAKGLGYSPTGAAEKVLRVYTDANTIPRSDRTLVAAVTERNIVVNYPTVRALNPRREATRAEVAALIYRALVSTGEATDISSPYVVGENTRPQETSEQPRPTQRRQVAPTRRPVNNNSSTRQTQPSRTSNTANSATTYRVRRTTTTTNTTVERSTNNNNNRTRRTTTVQPSTTNQPTRRTSTQTSDS